MAESYRVQERHRSWRGAAPLAFMLLLFCGRARAGGVVSLDLCADQYLTLLAPARVAALTMLARDPAISFVARQAAGLPRVRADAEAVLRLRPDLVLAGHWGAQPTVAALRAQGVRVVLLEDVSDWPAIRAQTRRLAAVLGVPARGEAMVAAMDRVLAAAAPPPAPARTAMVWEARGWTAGPDSVGAAVLASAGLRNVGTGGRAGLESLLMHPPDLLVTEGGAVAPSLATDLLSHPALAGLPRISLPSTLLICAGPWTAAAVLKLTRVRGPVVSPGVLSHDAAAGSGAAPRPSLSP